MTRRLDNYDVQMYRNSRTAFAVRVGIRYATGDLPTPQTIAREFGCSRATSYRWAEAIREARAPA